MFVSYSLHESIVGFCTIRQKRIRGGVRSLKVTACHLNHADCCYEYNFISVPRIARRYTILSAARQTHTRHTVYIELDGGRQAGKERGRIEGGREGASGGWEGTRGGRE